ncbi:MAG: dihydroorotase [Rhodocyclaceae bacterium]
MKIQVRNARLVDPASGSDEPGDLFVAAGRIVAIGSCPDGFHANRVIDATGLVLCPGLVDLSARLREPGYEYKATLESEMEAAVAGGVTTLACPPDTDPPLDEPGLVEMLKHRARNLNRAHVCPLGALTVGLAGERLTEMAELSEAGCVGFSQAVVPVTDTGVLRHAMQYAASFGYAVWLQPEDRFLAGGGVAHDGEVATRLGLAGIPVVAETVALFTLLQLARETGARLHVMRLSSAAGVAMLRAAREGGLSVSADVSINHLHLSETDIGYFDAHARLSPPLRSRADREALRAAAAEGVIDAVCSDHAPVDDDAKQLPFAEAEPGATGLELLLPLTLKWGRECGVPLARTLSRITSEPARILGCEAGRLEVGAAADLCLFDPSASRSITRAGLLSQGKNTPFLGAQLQGVVRMTLIAGNVVYEARPGQV